MKETWKDIKNYEGLYQVSNLGKVRSLNRMIKNKDTSYAMLGQLKKLKKHLNGYYSVMLYKNGEGKRILIHRLVADSFVANDMNKSEVNHVDGNKENNNALNLEWVTPSENHLHYQKIIKSKKRGIRKARTGKFEARIMIRFEGVQKGIHLGTFLDKEEAYLAFYEAYYKQYGKYPW